MLKILQVNKFYAPITGGVERVVQQLAEGLRDKTHMAVLACQKKGPTVRETIGGVPVLRCHSFGVAFSMPVSLSFLYQFRREAKKTDVVHLHLPCPLTDLALLLSGYRGKVAVWWHSDIVRQKKLLALLRPLLKRTLRRADAIVVATQGHIDGSDFLPAFREKCRIVPFGVEPSIMQQADAYLARKKEGLPVPGNPPVSFLFVGRFVYYKGCDVLLRAFAKAALPDVALILVGDGPLKGELKALAKELGVERQVRFQSGLDDNALSREFAACDVLVLPSIAKIEAFGLVQIEAMAYGKPVINTNLPSGVPHAGIHGATGLTVAPGDADALAAAMKRLAENPEERREMGRAARKRVEERYTMERMLAGTLELYEELAATTLQ